MRLAYVISAYKLPHQLIRLVERLNSPEVSFFVHVDKKTDEATAGQMFDGLKHLANVQFLRRHSCYWGGFGHVAATLEGVTAIVRTGSPYEYAALLTGQDYPIKSNPQINSYLDERRGSQFMEYFALPFDGWTAGGLDRFEGWHWRPGGRHLAIRPAGVTRRFPAGHQPFGGSSYWCLTGEAISYVHEYVRAHPGYVRFFRYVNVPDEMFFQTIMLNSPFRGRVVNDNLRYIEWGDPSSGSPEILETAHLERLAASPALFARKFDTTIDGDVLDGIDEKLLGLRPSLA